MNKLDLELADKVIFITGAASGIGKETAKKFAQERAKVVVADFDEKGGVETVDEIVKAGGKAIFVKLNVTNRLSIEEAVKRTISEFGNIHTLIANAGIVQDAMLLKMTQEQWDKVIAVNLTGVFNCVQIVAAHMVEAGTKGVILVASSVVGRFGNVGQVNYVTSKAGVIGMILDLMRELGRKGIRVNAVAPGFIHTPMTGGVPDKVLEMMKEKTPLRRLGEPGDVASVYVFLASNMAGYVNGAVIPVDGGLVI